MPNKGKLTWHNTGDNEFEAGVKDVVLYVYNNSDTSVVDSAYEPGVAWNGVTAINENPAGADKTELYADDVKYAVLRAAETFGFTIEAYTYPDEWCRCDGSIEAEDGVFLGQQARQAFGIVYKTSIGDETKPGMDKGYKIHVIYNCTASPSSRGYTTINDNPDAITFSWEADSTAVAIAGTNYKPVSSIVFDSTKMTKAKLKLVEDALYGKDAETNVDDTYAYLPSPADLLDLVK